MINILREPDDIRIVCEGENIDVCVGTEIGNKGLNVWVEAEKSRPKFILLRWKHEIDSKGLKIMGDTWERSYGDLHWGPLCCDRLFPWYFLADFGKHISACGVKVRPNSFVTFECDARGVSVWFDVRCGAKGVELGGRKLLAGTVVCEQYEGITAFEAATEFCKVMCEDPIFPKKPVYGGNNWYYAYGKSNGEQVRRDAKLMAELSEGNDNPPFMVIDDGWSQHRCSGPWYPNDEYGDMQKIAEDFKAMGVLPGVWIRALHDCEVEKEHPEWLLHNGNEQPTLDPSRPEVLEYVSQTVSRIAGWGYELLKHDYSTHDIFGPNATPNGMVTGHGNWSFYDKTRTSAEIVLEFYRTIKKSGNGMIVIGCNTISHLCAGLFEINRIGDDTSGKNWCRTRSMGVNTLAFRMPQNRTFYMADADCVGIKDQRISWSLNKQWLDLLAYSGSPLFVSCQPDVVTEEMKKDIKEAFAVNSVQTDVAIPLDWQDNYTPEEWSINGKVRRYDWIEDSYPILMHKRDIPN